MQPTMGQQNRSLKSVFRTAAEVTAFDTEALALELLRLVYEHAGSDGVTNLEEFQCESTGKERLFVYDGVPAEAAAMVAIEQAWRWLRRELFITPAGTRNP